MAVSGTVVSHSYQPGSAMAPESLAGIEFTAPSELQVVHKAALTGAKTTLAEGTHYVLGGNGLTGTGTITATGTWPADDLFTITRVTPRTQPSAFNVAEPVSPAGAERALDRLTRIAQEIGQVSSSALAIAEASRELNQLLVGLPGYFETLAAGIAATSEGDLFSSDESGGVTIYRRTATAPYYEWIGAVAVADEVRPEWFPQWDAADATGALLAAVATGRHVRLTRGITYTFNQDITLTTSGQFLGGDGQLAPVGNCGIVVAGGSFGVRLACTFNAPAHTGILIKVADADRVVIERHMCISGHHYLYVERANTTTLQWGWSINRGYGIKWYGDATKRSDILNISQAIINPGDGFAGLDWDGNCHTLNADQLEIIGGPNKSAANSLGVLIRNTSGGPPPEIGRFGYVALDYCAGPGIDIIASLGDLDFTATYSQGHTGSGIRIGAGINADLVRIHGGKFSNTDRYGIENLAAGEVLYSGSADLGNNTLGKILGNVRTETPRLNLDDTAYLTAEGSNPILNFDAGDYIGFNRATNIGIGVVGAVQRWGWTEQGLFGVQGFKTPQEFGAKGDGVADDTTAVQSWANYCAANHARGYAPPGTYKLTAPITVPISEGFALRGAGPTQTVFSMATDNTIIFDLGGAAGDTYLRYVDFGGFTLTYANSQTSAMTGALPVRFSAMMFQSRVTDIRFYRGYYCMTVASGVIPPWGCTFNDLFLEREVTGGFMDHLASGAGGVPNNVYGRLGADGLNCTQALFRNFKSYSSHMDAFEVFNLRTPVFFMSSFSQLSIGSIKMELVDLTGITDWVAQFGCQSLFYGPDCSLSIGHLNCSGSPNKLNPGQLGWMFNGRYRSLRIDFAKIDATQATSNFYVFGTNNLSEVWLGDYRRDGATHFPPWQYNGGTETSARLTIAQDNNSRVSADKGNADYTMAQGDPCFVQWETALTAPRTMNLPNTFDDLFNGYRIRVTSRGAVNGANTLAIKAGATTVATLTADNTWVELMWRKNGAAGVGWYVVASSPVLASTGDVLTGTDTAKALTADSVAALWEQGADVASAATITLGDGGYFNITGTTTITDIDFTTDKAGRRALLKFAGALTLTHGAALILPGAANIVTAAGDVAEFVSEGSDVVRCVRYQRANGENVLFGYATGSGGTVTQVTSRTTGVTLNKASGQITLVSAAGSATYQSFTVTNSLVGANDTIDVVQKSGTDRYIILVTKVQAGSFEITFATTGGTTTEQPVFTFNVIDGAIA